jgi:hypothetical protein
MTFLLRALTLAVGVTILAASPARAVDFFVFKAAISLPVFMVIEQPSAPTDRYVSRKLAANDLINLALGRPLGTKVDKNTEVLALAITFAEDADLSKIIVFDPSQNGVAQVKATIARVTSIDLSRGFKGNGQFGYGAVTGAVEPTLPPGPNGFLASTLHGSGSGGGPFGFGQPEKGSGKGTVTGRLRFNVDGGLFDGIVVGGKAKASGKVIGVFTE